MNLCYPCLYNLSTPDGRRIVLEMIAAAGSFKTAHLPAGPVLPMPAV